MLRKPSSLTIHVTLAVALPTPETFTAGTEAPSKQEAPMRLDHSHSLTSLAYWFVPRFPMAASQMSCSTKPFIHSAVTQ